MTFHAVAKASELSPGEARIYRAGETRILLCNVGGSFYAVEDICTHDEGPLGEGTLLGEAIECPRHGARFNVKTGAVLRMPAAAPIKTFATKLENGMVSVEVE
ncbi:MAG: non-heme iron oxygenase ferredoxin subunit [Elusimicrobia bacterium]|nr:non-heme iron oxygenase ferredoxin subunit [Elusimicrobiota bacterium]